MPVPESGNSLRIDIYSAREDEATLSDRAKRLKPGPPPPLDPVVAAVQFLRGVGSRAALSLPAFYLYLASSAKDRDSCSVPEYAGAVLTHWIKFSSINTITLSCRQAFDHSTKGLTSSTLTDDSVLQKVAVYWAQNSGRSVEEAQSALVLLRAVFAACSRSNGVLLDGKPTLGKRVGLLKQHADRTAAHLSLENHEFSEVDCAHVVAALTLIGAIIRTFDDSDPDPDYFNMIDKAALAAAKAIFPRALDLRLFGEMNIAEQAHRCWKHDHRAGLQMLLERLPYAFERF